MTNSQALVFALEAPSLATRWTLEVYTPADEKAPLASKNAPVLSLVGSSSGPKVDATTPASNITSTAPATGRHSYIVRSTVNGGVDAKGRADPNLIFERLIVIRTPGGRRKIIASEGTQYTPGGWADAQNDDVEASTDPTIDNVEVMTAHGATGDGVTVDQAAIVAGVAAALARGVPLLWASGTYVSDATIPSFHAVKHVGAGVVKRGTDLFPVQPKASSANTLYVASGGSGSNDGLSAAQPFATPQQAFDALKNYGPELEGQWEINQSASTVNVHRQQHTTPSKKAVIYRGPSVGGHPNVPTAIIDGTTPVADDWGIRATGAGVQIDVQDVKFQNFTGGAGSPTGILADYGASLYFTNVHGNNNGYSTIYCQGSPVVRGGGGIISSPRGFQLNSCKDVTLGYGAVPVRLNSCSVSCIEWGRGTQGHIDYVEFNDSAIHVDIFHNARAHLMGNNHKRATVGAVRCRTGGIYYDDLATPNNYNEGTADANAAKFLNGAFSGESDEDLFLSHSNRRRAFNKNSFTHTGTTAVTQVSVLLTGAANSRIPAYWFEDNTKSLVVEAWGEFTTAAALAAVGLQLGGIEVDRITLTSGPAAGAQFHYVCVISAVGASSQFKRSRLMVDGQSPKLQQNSPTVATSADLALAVNLKLANSGDTAKIFWSEAWLIG